MSSSITYHAISNDKYRPERSDWILRPWSELYDQDPEFTGWLASSLGVLRPHLILARDKALLSSTAAAAAAVGSRVRVRVRTTDDEKYNTALLELFHPLVPGVDARLMNHIGRAVFSFDRSSKEGLRDIQVVDGPSYGESASVRKQIEWRAAGKVLRAAADDSQQDSQVNEDGGGDGGDGDGGGRGRARGSGNNGLRGGEGSSLKVAKTRSRSDAASLSHSRDGSLLDNAGCHRPDLFGLVVSCGPEPKPNPKLTVPGHPRASPILSQRRTDQRPKKMLDPPRASDISGQPDKLRSRLSTHSSPLPMPTFTNTPLSLSTRDDGRHHPSVGSRPPFSPNTIARSEEEARGVTRAVWIQGEIKPRREQLIEGQSSTVPRECCFT